MGMDYAERVAAGLIPVARPTRLAAERQLRDLEQWRGKDQPYFFSERKANKVCSFVEAMPHIKGRWAREQSMIKLEAWQAFILTTIFGWLRTANQMRRFRTVYIEVPRKNAKSTLTSAVAAYMLTYDDEEGAEVYSAGTTREQAGIVFRDTLAMCRKSPQFRKALGVKLNNWSICVPSTNSRMMALSSQDQRLDGLNPSLSILDEVHAMDKRGLYDVLDTAMGARSQPLLWMITTAGTNQTGICFEQHRYASRILGTGVQDETYFGIIYSIDEDDNWTDPSNWQKANPNYGVSVDPEDLERVARKAIASPAGQNAFMTKHLNVWVHADSAWLDMLAWNMGRDESLNLDAMAGRPCYIGLDLAARNDIASATLLFPLDEGGGEIALFHRGYLPEDTVERNEADRDGKYRVWVRQGRLIATDGAITDMDVVVDDLVEFVKQFDVRAICFDPYQVTPLLGALQKRGVTVPLIKINQRVEELSAPMKELEAMVQGGLVKHDGDPCLAWMMSNVISHRDKKDNVYPHKERYENKIDGAVAAMMAMHRYMAEYHRGCVYTERGLLAI
jgi:phage terminase large subunit-like protein